MHSPGIHSATALFWGVVRAKLDELGEDGSDEHEREQQSSHQFCTA
jgi:hypothetical protein